MNDLVREGYNKAAESYSFQRDQFKTDKYLDQLIEQLRPRATILDIGCGSGIPIDRYLVNLKFQVIGIDISEKQIELAKNNVPDAVYAVKDMSELKEGEFQVDAVIAFYAIFHTPRKQHQDLFRKINSYLPEGGLILVTMGSSDWEGTEDDFHGVKMYWSHYNSEKNRQIIEEAGFRVLFDEIDLSGNEKHQVVFAKKK